MAAALVYTLGVEDPVGAHQRPAAPPGAGRDPAGLARAALLARRGPPRGRGGRGHPLGRLRAPRSSGGHRPARRGRPPARVPLAPRGGSRAGGRAGAAGVAGSIEPRAGAARHPTRRRLVGCSSPSTTYPPAATAILARAEGNPFFLEEILRHPIDEGQLVATGGDGARHSEARDIEIPDTVQAVLAARIDLLALVEARTPGASVVGRVFWIGAVARSSRTGRGGGRGARATRGPRARALAARVEYRRRARIPLQARPHARRRVSRLARRERARAHVDVAAWIELPRGSASASSPICSHITSGSRTRDPPPTGRSGGPPRGAQAAIPQSSCSLHQAQSRMPPDKANAFGEARWTSPPTARAVTGTRGARPVRPQGLSRR